MFPHYFSRDGHDVIHSLANSVVKSYGSYLHVPIFPCEKNDDWQASDDAALQDKYRRSHQPVEGYDARRAVLAGLASFGARQAFEHSVLGILVLLALLTKKLFSLRWGDGISRRNAKRVNRYSSKLVIEVEWTKRRCFLSLEETCLMNRFF